MRTIILSALLGLGIGLAGIPAANAAPASGLSSTALEATLLQDVQYYRGDRYYRGGRHYRGDRRWRRPHCRSVQVCRRGPYGRRCHIERVCRR